MKQDFDWGLTRSLLATNLSRACCLLPPILARMQQRLPDIPIERVVSKLLRPQADIAQRFAPIPIWQAVHREIRTRARIRAEFDFLADAVPDAL